MRKQDLVDLGFGRYIVIRELRVRDVRNLLAQTELVEQLDIFELRPDRAGELETRLGDCLQMPKGKTLKRLRPAKINEIKEKLLAVNQAFLKPAGSGGRAAKDPVKELDNTCIVLIERGHVGVFDYGWGFFINVCNWTIQQSQKKT